MNWSAENIAEIPSTSEDLPLLKDNFMYRSCPGATRDMNKQRECGASIFFMDKPYCRNCGVIVRDLLRRKGSGQ